MRINRLSLRNPHFITICAWINILVIALLFTDTFLIKPEIVSESFTESTHRKGVANKRMRSRTTYYVETESGHRYNVPAKVYIELSHERSSFYVHKSALFARNLHISYIFEGRENKIKTGLLNETAFGILLGIVALLFSLLNLTQRPILIPPPYSYGMVFSASFSVIIMLICYFSA
jgi:hypothetical protein